MINNINKFFVVSVSGLNTWNSGENHVDLEHELDTITDCAPPGEEARGGEYIYIVIHTTHELDTITYCAPPGEEARGGE